MGHARKLILLTDLSFTSGTLHPSYPSFLMLFKAQLNSGDRRDQLLMLRSRRASFIDGFVVLRSKNFLLPNWPPC
jgi:hypothetical protein